jgi:hypothetical protein
MKVSFTNHSVHVLRVPLRWSSLVLREWLDYGRLQQEGPFQFVFFLRMPTHYPQVH